VKNSQAVELELGKWLSATCPFAGQISHIIPSPPLASLNPSLIAFFLKTLGKEEAGNGPQNLVTPEGSPLFFRDDF
jgi:hypothetical protein